MSAPVVRDSAADRIQSRLSSLPGIRSVDLSDFPRRVTLRCDAAGLRAFAADAIQTIVRDEAGAEPEIRVELTSLQSARTRRARFESVEVQALDAGRISASVVLDWQKERFSGEAEGEASQAGELRACAIATMRAVEQVASGEVTFTLIGAKELHVFDHDLIAVLLQSPQLPEHRLIGTSIIATDRRRSAALAVLSATNRAVGNFVDSAED